jgi:hypothetical protein
MDNAKSYRMPGDIGGPMNIGEGYRWNVPVITYGFERSFLDYFGSNGVAAVEGAIQILNQLPPVSLIYLDNYPTNAWRVNYRAEALSLLDLKSTTLSVLLEQMGLAAPERYAFCIRDYSATGSNYTFFVIQRNFDPVTARPSHYVNDTLLSYQIVQFASSPPATGQFCDAVELPVDTLSPLGTTVAGFGLGPGYFVTDLSRDDVAGLRYLLNGNQVRYEALLPDVHEAGANTNLVRSAYRPGIEKISFVRHPVDGLSGGFRTFTNRWTDVYYAGDYPAYQEVVRSTSRPDIVFTASDLGVHFVVTRTGTTNWANNADFNGNPGGAGPGIIQPPVAIAMNNVGFILANTGPFYLDEATSALGIQLWGSFDGSTNPVVVFPESQFSFQPTQFRLKLVGGNRTNEFRWLLSGQANGRFFFQTATNLNSWITLRTLTNSGDSFDCLFEAAPDEPGRFFRTFPE